LYVAGALFFLVNIIFNYTGCTFTDPGNSLIIIIITIIVNLYAGRPPENKDAYILGEETVNLGGKTVRRFATRYEVVPGASYRYCKYGRTCSLLLPLSTVLY
jgi:hypothetical protein